MLVDVGGCWWMLVDTNVHHVPTFNYNSYLAYGQGGYGLPYVAFMTCYYYIILPHPTMMIHLAHNPHRIRDGASGSLPNRSNRTLLARASFRDGPCGDSCGVVSRTRMMVSQGPFKTASPVFPAELLKSFKGFLWHKCVSMSHAQKGWCVLARLEKIRLFNCMFPWKCSQHQAFDRPWPRNVGSRHSPNDTIQLQPYDYVLVPARLLYIYIHWSSKTL